MADEQPESKQIPVVWVGTDEVPVYFVNQFVTQVDKGEVFVTFGQMVPPAILPGSPDQIREQVERLEYVAVRPVARLAFTPARLLELIQALEITKAGHEKQSEELRDPRDS
jgi:hypothetical protein